MFLSMETAKMRNIFRIHSRSARVSGFPPFPIMQLERKLNDIRCETVHGTRPSVEIVTDLSRSSKTSGQTLTRPRKTSWIIIVVSGESYPSLAKLFLPRSPPELNLPYPCEARAGDVALGPAEA